MEWKTDYVTRFRASARGNAQVVELPDVPHYFFVTKEAKVVHTMRAFLLGEK